MVDVPLKTIVLEVDILVSGINGVPDVDAGALDAKLGFRVASLETLLVLKSVACTGRDKVRDKPDFLWILNEMSKRGQRLESLDFEKKMLLEAVGKEYPELAEKMSSLGL